MLACLLLCTCNQSIVSFTLAVFGTHQEGQQTMTEIPENFESNRSFTGVLDHRKVQYIVATDQMFCVGGVKFHAVIQGKQAGL